MLTKKIALLLIVTLFFIAGCGKAKTVPAVGSPDSPARISNGITFFSSEAEVRKPFTVVGTIYYMDPGEYKRLKFDDIVPVLAAKTKALGANGMIIDIQEPVLSGFYERGIEVSGRAIKY